MARFIFVLLPLALGELVAYDFKGRGSTEAVSELLSRVLHLSSQEVGRVFDLELVSQCSSGPPRKAKTSLCFEVSNVGGRVKVKGTSGIELAYGAAWYLRTRCNMPFSWERTGGNQVKIPSSWPPAEAVTKYRTVPMSYFNNVVTFSYSYVWYDFSAWERWLDWAALSGINLVTAYTGQEEIYRKTFRDFGVSDEHFANWSNGVAWLAWSRGQSMHGVGSDCGDACMPLPESWMKAQWQLQEQILKRSRALGMVSVLPTFQGNVPPIFRSLYPKANISKSGAAWMDALDPLFGRIQKRYMEIMIADWGTDHWYEADGYFDQQQGPWKVYETAEEVPIDPVAFAHAAAAYKSMNATDPKAIWLYQGWIWRGWGHDKLPFMKAFVTAVPPKHFVMLDMFDEASPEWSQFHDFGYFGAPFIWSVLHNFGGNTGLWGSLPTLNSKPFEAFERTRNVAGTGAAPEGIDQNPMYYNFLTDLSFRQEPVDLDHWIEGYALQRYGRVSLPAQEALGKLLASVYAEETNRKAIGALGGFQAEKNADGLTARPLGDGYATPHKMWYDRDMVLSAWERLLAAASEGEVSSTMNYDLVNVGREVLSKLSNGRYEALLNASTASEVAKRGEEMLELMLDAERLLCCDSGFLTASWLKAAGSWASVGQERYFDLAARSLTTTWTPQAKGSRSITALCDYANRQWAGQVGGLYRLRYKCYIQQALKDLSRHQQVNKTAYEACVAQVSFDWTHDFEGTRYPMCSEPSGETLAVSKELFRRYGQVLELQV